MRLKKLIKRFELEETNRSKITLGDNVRLNPLTNSIELISDSDDHYSTDSDLYAKTWITNPNSVKEWNGFECEAINAKDDLGQEITGVNFRLSDGTDEYWWNGASWEANVVDWNTEIEVAANISDFPITSKSIQVILNPYTTDEDYTPSISLIKILYSSDLKHYEDYIYRTIVKQLKTIRPISDYPFILNEDTSEIDLVNDYPLETPYNIIGIDAVFDHTNDSDHNIDLYQSFDSINKVITLSSTVSEGNTLWVQFTWEPEVAVSTSNEYIEVSKVPSLIIDGIQTINTSETSHDDWVNNKSDGTSVKILGPRIANIEFSMQALTSTARDQTRLAEELIRFFNNNPTITSYGMDEDFRLWLLDEFDEKTFPTQNDVHANKLRFLLVNAVFYEQDAVYAFMVTKFKFTGDMDAEIN